MWEIKNKNVRPEIKKGDKTYTTGPDIAIDIGTLQFLLILICIRIILLGRTAFRIFRA